MKRVQFIRDIASNANLFVGLDGEITVDTTARELRLHDGTTPGGYGVARKDLANISAASSTNAGKMTAAQVIVLENAMQRPLAWTVGRLTKFDTDGDPIDSGVTATETQLNYLSGVTAGTRTVNKAIVVDVSGFIDALGITTATVTTANITNLQIGGVAVTATAVELNYTDVTAAGAAQGSKAAVLDANKSILGLGPISLTNSNTTAKITMSGISDSASYNYLISASNDAGVRAVHFVNGSTAVSDGGANAYVIRNAGGDLILGNIALTYPTRIYGSTVTINGNTVWHSGNDGYTSGLIAEDSSKLGGFAANDYYRVGSTDVAINDGGTGASNANSARENLGIFHGRVLSTGTADRLPSGWSSVKNSTGFYTVTHNLGTTAYSAVGNITGTVGVTVSIIHSTNSFDVTTRLHDGTVQDAPFFFTLIKD